MADSPTKKSDRVLSCTVYSEGKDVGSDYRLVSAFVRMEANRIGKATLQFNAGDMAKQTFKETDSDTFKPGKTIRLDAGTPDAEKTIFEGVVVMLNMEIDEQQRPRMVVECRDVLFAATLGRKNKVFEKQKDSEIIQTVLSSYGNVSVDATSFKHPALVQYYCTDWDFALSRADVNGLLITCAGKEISVKKPKVSDSPVVTVAYGVDLIDFRGGVSATEQFAAVEAVSWDIGKQAVVKTSASKPALNKQGNTAVTDLETGDKYLVQTDIPAESGVMKAWADSLALKAGLARYRGTFSFSGNAAVVPGCIVELKGLGARFNGNVFVGAVEHTIREQVWITRVDMGISPQNITDEPDVTAPPASGRLPGIEGLHIGKVKQLKGDPAGELRILVDIPVLDGDNNSIWARWATLYAGEDRGHFFLPEPDDEVVVGFLNNDPVHPVILGNLYSSKQPAPYELDDKNLKKVIATKEKLKIEFDDEKKMITLETPGKNKIEINDDKKSIQLTDQNKNQLTLNDQGITFDCAKNIVLKAKGDISLEASGKVEVKAKMDMTLEGMNVNANAKVGFAAKGKATAEVSASGQTTIKGGMVMIN